jgi:hypothetical protein
VIGVARDGARLELFVVDSSGSAELITSTVESGDAPSVHLSSYGGQTGLAYNTFLFGVAPEGATRFELDPPGTALGGEVFAGTFVVALHERDVPPDQLQWAFLRQDGSVVVEGSGIRG